MSPRACFALLLLACPIPCALATRVADVRVVGIDDPVRLHNVIASLSVQRARTAEGDISERRLEFLLSRAADEVRTALEPYGYYDATIQTQVQRQGAAATVVITVQPGRPVKVTSRQIAVRGPAGSDTPVQRMVEKFTPRPGQTLDHRRYESSKQAVDRVLAERGYFDAKLASHRVEVTRALHAASIDVAWDSGPRYGFGTTTFGPNQFKPGLLDPLVRWKVGSPYRAQALLDLQQSLADLDWFSTVEVAPDIDHRGNGQVPITVTTTPAKRTAYSAGLSYGTDSGAGITLGFDRRWLNRRGHRFDSQFEWAQNRKLFAARYRIPAFAWLDGWYALSTRLSDEQTDAGHTRLAELVGSRTGRFRRWNLTAAFHVQRERYQDALYPGFDRYATLVFPAFSAQTSRGNNRLYPTRGWGLAFDTSAGTTAIGSDVDFAQVHARATWVHGFGARNRLLLRGEIGRVFTGDFYELPPSLRFYAGGDTSVRGYSYQEIGPRVNGQNIGAPNLLVASVEFEHRFTRDWGMAVFADDGDAFDDRPHSNLGFGLGLRWRSPVGPVRIDLAHGVHSASPLHLHFNIGTDL